MGTRSTVKFYDEYQPNTPILSVYQQYDGYISGVGHKLAKFLQRKTVINGYGSQTMETHANGMWCLAAQYVAENKTGIGGFYCTNSKDSQEYNYQVRHIDGKFQIKCDKIFKGTSEQLLEFTEE